MIETTSKLSSSTKKKKQEPRGGLLVGTGRTGQEKERLPPSPPQQQHERIDHALVDKAVTALLQYHQDVTVAKSKTVPLLGLDTIIQVQFGLEVAPQKGTNPKPIRIMIPHPIYQVIGKEQSQDDEDDDTTNKNTTTTTRMAAPPVIIGVEEPEVCLIVKDESKPWVQEMIQSFPHHMKCIKKVMTLQSLRTKHTQFQQRRELLHKYNVFMTDDRILPMVGKALGRDFYRSKKLPIPVKLTRKEALPLMIQRALSATFLTLSEGTCVTIRAGSTAMPVQNLTENIMAIAMNAVDKIPRHWGNIRSISIKTPESTSLPFYNKTPQELMEIAKMAGLSSIWKEKTPTVAGNKRKVDSAETETMDQNEQQKKQLEKEKSPLLRALKKQKQEKTQVQKNIKGTSPMKEAKESTIVKLDMIEKEKSKSKKENKPIKTSTDMADSKSKSDVHADDKTENKSTTSITATSGKQDKVQHVGLKNADTKQKAPQVSNKKLSQDTKKEEEGDPMGKKRKTSSNSKPIEDKERNTTKMDVKPMISNQNESINSKKLKSTIKQVNEKEEKKSSSQSPCGGSTTTTTTNESMPFMESPRFTGSKDGYVFKKGMNGLGYYKDSKPVVDKKAMEAFQRMSNQRNPSNKGNRGGGGGGRAGRGQRSTSAHGKRAGGGGGYGRGRRKST